METKLLLKLLKDVSDALIITNNVMSSEIILECINKVEELNKEVEEVKFMKKSNMEKTAETMTHDWQWKEFVNDAKLLVDKLIATNNELTTLKNLPSTALYAAGMRDGIEKCAKWHEQQVLGKPWLTDHDIYAERLRELKE